MTKKELYEKAVKLPLLPGIYIISDKGGTIIYIGKAKRLRTRVSQYFREGVPHDMKVTKMIDSADSFEFIVTTSEFEALVLECSQIKQHKPKYNILLKDDKGYSYIKVTKGDYPRITAELQRKDDDAEYIGPYMSSFAVREMVETTVNAFRLPTCSKVFPRDFRKERPCLNHYIGKCMAVCNGKTSKKEYDEHLAQAVALIKNGKGEIIKTLKVKMNDAAENLEFEKAAQLRDKVVAIEKALNGQRVVESKIIFADIFSIAAKDGCVCAAMLAFRDGRLIDKNEFLFTGTEDVSRVREELLQQYYENKEIPPLILIDALPEAAEDIQTLLQKSAGRKVAINVPQRGDGPRLVQMATLNAIESLTLRSGRVSKQERLLDEVAKILGLEKTPNIIESYDISNWGDGTSVAGMIVFENGKPKRSGYRTFKMKTVVGTDDYASMAETLQRRVNQYENDGTGQFAVKPDLILLDGGKGQLSTVVAAIAGTKFADIPIFGMVKDDRHRTRAIVGKGGEIAVSMHKSVFSFITSVQDEVHRFSIEFQRKQSKQKTFKSGLTEIEGVGEATAKKLLKNLKSIKAISGASKDELINAGANKAQADAIIKHYLEN